MIYDDIYVYDAAGISYDGDIWPSFVLRARYDPSLSRSARYDPTLTKAARHAPSLRKQAEMSEEA